MILVTLMQPQGSCKSSYKGQREAGESETGDKRIKGKIVAGRSHEPKTEDDLLKLEKTGICSPLGSLEGMPFWDALILAHKTHSCPSSLQNFKIINLCEIVTFMAICQLSYRKSTQTKQKTRHIILNFFGFLISELRDVICRANQKE